MRDAYAVLLVAISVVVPAMTSASGRVDPHSHPYYPIADRSGFDHDGVAGPVSGPAANEPFRYGSGPPKQDPGGLGPRIRVLPPPCRGRVLGIDDPIPLRRGRLCVVYGQFQLEEPVGIPAVIP